MSFFEPPPPPEPWPEHEALDLPWLGKPGNALGGVVDAQLVLAQTEQLAVAVRELVAFQSGFAFELALRWRSVPASWEEHRRRHAAWHGLHQWPGRKLRPETFRFGIELADGAKATNVGPSRGHGGEGPSAALVSCGGGGTDTRMDMQFWFSPLPPPGPVAFVCEWPSEGVALTRVELQAAVVRAAADRSELLWGRRESGFGGSHGSSGQIQLWAAPEDEP